STPQAVARSSGPSSVPVSTTVVAGAWAATVVVAVVVVGTLSPGSAITRAATALRGTRRVPTMTDQEVARLALVLLMSCLHEDALAGAFLGGIDHQFQQGPGNPGPSFHPFRPVPRAAGAGADDRLS